MEHAVGYFTNWIEGEDDMPNLEYDNFQTQVTSTKLAYAFKDDGDLKASFNKYKHEYVCEDRAFEDIVVTCHLFSKGSLVFSDMVMEGYFNELLNDYKSLSKGWRYPLDAK